MDVFARNLGKRMKACGMTQSEVAKLARTPRPNVSRILHGRENVTLERAERIASAVGCTLAELISEDFSESANPCLTR